MMQGDDIRNHRLIAQSRFDKAESFDAERQYHGSLALWVIAEQLYELRENLSLVLHQLQKGEQNQ